MRTLNLGILAHVDAGKTTLTERLLYAAGVIDEVGSVDDGSTHTDSLALERQRGITIKSAVVSFVMHDVTVNLIDTPGHPDFIAEVERVLSILDGAVLVVSAVEGVQAQTRILMRTLRRLCIPTLIFVNKIDRAGAREPQLLGDISQKLSLAAVPMGAVSGVGTRDATFTPFADGDDIAGWVDVLAEHNDEFLAGYVDDFSAVSPGDLRAELAAQTSRVLAHPVFFGSATTGAGVTALTTGITTLLPTANGDADAPVSGTVFKIERGPSAEQIAYVRLFSGTVRLRDLLEVRPGNQRKVTAIGVFEHGDVVRRTALSAGQIGKLWGLGGIQIGDAIGRSRPSPGHSFAPPTLETVILPRRPADRGPLQVALGRLAEQDPLINLRLDVERQEVAVSLYGEVQKEVIKATLANDFGIDVDFRETTTICIERPIGSGAHVQIIGEAGNPFLATVGLRVDPAPIDTGVAFRREVELGSMPFAFFTAVEDAVKLTLQQGIHGRRVTDCTVTMTHSGYYSMSSTAGDFRQLTPLVLMRALKTAGTRAFEPIHRFRLEFPADTLGVILRVLARLRAIPRAPAARGSSILLAGDIPATRVHELTQLLPALTHGEGVLESAFDRYRAVIGAVPTRPRSDS